MYAGGARRGSRWSPGSLSVMRHSRLMSSRTGMVTLRLGQLKYCWSVVTLAHRILSLNPGRIDPLNIAWEETRKPTAALWKTTSGERFFTVNVHLSSKRDSSSAHGDARPPVNGHVDRRGLQVNVAAVRICVFSLPERSLTSIVAHIRTLYARSLCTTVMRASYSGAT